MAPRRAGSERGDVLCAAGACRAPGGGRSPAPGEAARGARVQRLCAPLPVEADRSWGLDHGTWSVLRQVYPDASVPVVQLSIDESRPPAFHHELGVQLRALRDEGILLLGSRDIVHNLRAFAWDGAARPPHDWALRFEARVREGLAAGGHPPLT